MTAQDFTVAEHVNLLRSSASPFVQALFGESEGAVEAPKSGARGRASGSAFKLNSVGSQFRKQLQVRARLPHAQQGSVYSAPQCDAAFCHTPGHVWYAPHGRIAVTFCPYDRMERATCRA